MNAAKGRQEGMQIKLPLPYEKAVDTKTSWKIVAMTN